MQSKPCLFCGAPSTHLCDHVLGRNLEALRKHRSSEAMWKAPLTCDAPMCRRCARAIGHVCRRRGQGDTIDVCPVHAHLGMLPEGPTPAVEPADAEIYRGRMATYVRAQLRDGAPLRGVHDEISSVLGGTQLPLFGPG